MSSPPLLLSSISKLFTRKDFSVPPATPTLLLLLRTIFLAPAGLRPPPVASAVVYGVPPKKGFGRPGKRCCENRCCRGRRRREELLHFHQRRKGKERGLTPGKKPGAKKNERGIIAAAKEKGEALLSLLVNLRRQKMRLEEEEEERRLVSFPPFMSARHPATASALGG